MVEDYSNASHFLFHELALNFATIDVQKKRAENL